MDAAVVLAAGRSSRMGAFKPLMRFGSGTVLAHVVGVLRRAGIETIRVVCGHNADAAAPEAARLEVPAVVNPDIDRGMLGSVQCGIGALPATARGCLILPVDMPLVRPATIVRILRAAAEPGAVLVHPSMAGRRGHPPWIGRALFADILAAPSDGSLRAVLARHDADAREIAVFDTGCLRDMDRQEDYRDLARALAHHHVPDDTECEAMLAAAAAPAPVRRHGRAVAAVAVALARRLVRTGVALDIDLVRAGALLHDIAKGRPRHAEAGAALVAGFGFPDVAAVVGRHMAIDFSDRRITEDAVVHLADKLVCGERRVGLDERFEDALNRYAADPAARAGAAARRAAAEAILRAVEERLGPLALPAGRPASHRHIRRLEGVAP